MSRASSTIGRASRSLMPPPSFYARLTRAFTERSLAAWGFRLERPGQQRFDYLIDRRPAMQDGIDRADDRHLDLELLRERRGCRRGAYALRHRTSPRDISIELLALAERDAKAVIARLR